MKQTKNGLQALASIAGAMSSAILTDGELVIRVPVDQCGVAVSGTGKTYSLHLPKLKIQGLLDCELPLYAKTDKLDDEGKPVVVATGQVVVLDKAEANFSLAVYTALKNGTVKALNGVASNPAPTPSSVDVAVAGNVAPPLLQARPAAPAVAPAVAPKVPRGGGQRVTG